MFSENVTYMPINHCVAVSDMMAIYRDEQATEDERQRAVDTIVEVLFPNFGANALDQYNSARHSPAARATAATMADEEKSFSDRVQKEMTRQGVTQEQLADVVGVGQSAISNILMRNCRPQRRTVVKIAEALQVSAEYLWPNLVADKD